MPRNRAVPILATAFLLPAGLLTADLPAQLDASLLTKMRTRSIGPAGMSGRVVAIDAVARDPNTLYVGAASGGLWKSTNGGLTFTPVFDDQPVASIGAICIHQPSPDIVWVGSGEGNPRNSASVGNGVYRTNDGGRTWLHLGLDKTERIRRIWVHPTDPDTALVAALGTAWGKNPERGLFRTTDGGKHWSKVLFVDEQTGCIDIEVDPGNPKKMFAAMWQHRRHAWSFSSGGKGSGLYRSVDGGETWTRLSTADGLPSGDLGRIRPAFAPSAPHVVYALVESKRSVLLRSDDGGFRFRVVNREREIAPRPFYYCDLRVDPQDPERLYNLHSNVTVSSDGGKTFRTAIGWNHAHPDHHAMWICPSDPRVIYDGNDGGVAVTRDRGATWAFATQLPLAQLYHVAVDMDEPYHVYGGLQDNGSWRGPNTVWENGGVRNHHWDEVCFGDGFATLPDPQDSLQGYAMSQEGHLVRWNLRTGERRGIRPLDPVGADGKPIELRFNWNAAIAQDPFDPATIYFGSQFVHRSTDRGASWSRISDDLTSNFPQWQKQQASGGLTLDVTGAENFTTIMTIAPSPVQRGVLWVGSDDGRVHLTRDAGKNWESLEDRIPELPRHTWCPHLEASKFDAASAFAVFDDHRRSNWTPYVYRTADFGKTWQRLTTDGVRGYCHVLEQDPVDRRLLFLGTEFGLWVSTDAGAHWFQWTHGLPTCAARALVVHPRDHDLVIGTHGRAIYVLDDIRALRGLTAEVLARPLHLFAIPPAVQHRVRQTGASRFPGQGEFRGATRQRGALLTFVANGKGLKHPDPKVEAAHPRATSEPKVPVKAGATAKKPPEKPAAEKGEPRGKPAAEPRPKQPEAAAKKNKDPAVATIEIVDSSGVVIRRFEHTCTKGVNRAVWDLSRDGRPRPQRTPRRKDSPAPRGNPALPGNYTVRIELSGHKVEGALSLRADPREQIPDADRAARAQHADWTVTEDRMALTDRGLFLHCLPVRRNVVVTDAVLDGPRSVAIEEAGNRLHTARAVLTHCLGEDQD
ncbi:MAG: hypothetical protein KDC87_02040 [Planctomycetes bacterium]|nr:hypothetical protein [Planctomycetota bacterium]